MGDYAGPRPGWTVQNEVDGSMTIGLYGAVKEMDMTIRTPSLRTAKISATNTDFTVPCNTAIVLGPVRPMPTRTAEHTLCLNCQRKVVLHPTFRFESQDTKDRDGLPLASKPSLQIQSGERYVARNGKETGPAGTAAGEFCFRIDGEFYYYWPNGQPSRKISLNSCQAVPFTDPDWTLVSRLPKEPPAPKITHEAVREACITDLRALAGEYTKAIHLAHNLPISPDVSLLNGRSIVETCIRRLKDLDLDAIEG